MRVHASFRLICIEDVRTCGALPPPFINRFVKTHLRFSHVLSVPQRNLVAALAKDVRVAVDRTASVHLLELIVPGFCEDTLHSPAFTFPLAPNVDPDDFEDAVDQAPQRLGLVICPRRLLQVEHGLLAGFGGAASRAVVLLLWSVVAHLFSSLDPPPDPSSPYSPTTTLSTARSGALISSTIRSSM